MGKDPESDRKLNEIGACVNGVTTNSPQKKINKSMNKVCEFLKEKNSKLNEIISGIENAKEFKKNIFDGCRKLVLYAVGLS